MPCCVSVCVSPPCISFKHSTYLWQYGTGDILPRNICVQRPMGTGTLQLLNVSIIFKLLLQSGFWHGKDIHKYAYMYNKLHWLYPAPLYLKRTCFTSKVLVFMAGRSEIGVSWDKTLRPFTNVHVDLRNSNHHSILIMSFPGFDQQPMIFAHRDGWCTHPGMLNFFSILAASNLFLICFQINGSLQHKEVVLHFLEG